MNEEMVSADNVPVVRIVVNDNGREQLGCIKHK